MSDTGGVSVRFRDQFKAAPLILRVYIVFAGVAGAVGLSFFYARSFNEKLLPYTGAMGLFFYLMTLSAARAAIAAPERRQLLNLAFYLGLMVFYGCFDSYLNHQMAPLRLLGNTNPYLAYHPYRPLVTILVPAVWLLLVLSLLPKRWAKNA